MVKKYICPICGQETTEERYQEIKKEHPDLIRLLKRKDVDSLMELTGKDNSN